MEENKMLGKRLRSLRGKRTQEEVSKALGLSRARYSHYENNRVEPDTEILNKMADFFNVSTDYLLGRTDARELTIEEKLDKALQLRDGENIYFYDMEGLSDEDIEMLKKQIELYREMSEKRKKEKERRNKSE